ncbi:MAG: hypothetical protein JOY99_17985 [Sphingomonadaceae bacterium]|nr:hypothetical protein [Sphingomonadaceae bacterium]
MRLETHEIAAIKAATRLTFGPDAVVRVFGSRAFDDRRGGDIDLHVEHGSDIDMWRVKDDFLDRLFARIDAQRVDLIATKRGAEPTPIEAVAYRDGVIL